MSHLAIHVPSSLGSLSSLGDPANVVLVTDLEDDFGHADVAQFAINHGVNAAAAETIAAHAADNAQALSEKASSRSFWRGLFLGGLTALGTVIAIKAYHKMSKEEEESKVILASQDR
jgi:hypothetical protein